MDGFCARGDSVLINENLFNYKISVLLYLSTMELYPQLKDKGNRAKCYNISTQMILLTEIYFECNRKVIAENDYSFQCCKISAKNPENFPCRIVIMHRVTREHDLMSLLKTKRVHFKKTILNSWLSLRSLNKLNRFSIFFVESSKFELNPPIWLQQC